MITASDGKLTNETQFNFTVYNVNDAPVIDSPLTVDNATADSNSNINITEDNVTTITMWIDDNDFKIPSGQKSFYDENLTINLTIEGPNTSLFEFITASGYPTAEHPERTRYDATFTPKN